MNATNSPTDGKTAPPGRHPDPASLEKFVNGRLDEQESNRFEAHLQQCPSCCEILAPLSKRTDRFVAELVSAVDSDRVAPSTTGASSGRLAASCGGRSGDAPPTDVPKMVGRFEIHGEIGRGGFGIVLRGYDPSLQREVAIKIPRLRATLTDELRERFLREAYAAAALDHPNIVPVYEASQGADISYIAEAYCRGPNLSNWLKQRRDPVPVATAARLAATLASAVHHAHSRGILHCDLKPSNVLLEPREDTTERNASGSVERLPGGPDSELAFVPKIVDFGLARLAGGGWDLTATGSVMGTVSYMSPEQAGGKSGEIGPATDVYSLGAILYELLTGRPPLVGESAAETLQRVQHHEPIAPARLRPNLPRDLETICMMCLWKEPMRRYATAEALADDLQRFLRGEPIRARRASPLERSWRWCRRNPAVALLAACVGSLLLAVAGVSFAFAVRLSEREAEVRQHLERARGVERQRMAALCQSYRDQAAALRLSRRAGQRFQSLEILARAAALAPATSLGTEDVLQLRNEAAACLALPDLRINCVWEAYPPEAHGLGIGFDADVNRYARAEPDGQIAVRRLDDNRVLVRLPWVGEFPHTPLLRFSPNGRLLAVKDDQNGTVLLWDLPTQTLLWEHAGVPGTFRQDLDFSPDSHSVAWGQANGAILISDSDSGALRQRIPPGGLVQHLRFHPDGTKLAFFRPAEIMIANVDSGETIWSIPEQTSGTQALCWSPDGQYLAYAYYDNSRSDHLVSICDWRHKRRHVVLDGHQLAVIRISYSASGDLIATTSWDGTTRLWDPATSRQHLACPGYGVRFSRDDRWLAFGHLGHVVGRWEVAPGRERRSFRSKGACEVFQVSIAPEGRLVASGGINGVRLWDVETCRELANIPLGGGYAAFDPQTGHLFTSSPLGLHRWPVTRESRATGAIVRIGPPLLIAPLPCPPAEPPSLAAARQRMAVFQRPDQVAVFDLSAGEDPEPRIVGPVEGLPALSPDGHWVATSSWHGGTVKVWEVDRRTHACDLATIGGVVASFSPDGRWLVGGTGREYRFWRVGSWELDHIVAREHVGDPGPIAFTRDGTVAAVSHSPNAIKLVDPITGVELLRLPAPGPNVWFCFSPDGSQLLTTGENATIGVWDLARIGAQLADVGLAWEASTGSGTSRVDRPQPLQLQLDFGDLIELLERP
jgi:eukaryotic-like serine/threonine-protein kinase